MLTIDKNKNVSSDLPYASRAYQTADKKKGAKKKIDLKK
jgi:hypothetical protein